MTIKLQAIKFSTMSLVIVAAMLSGCASLFTNVVEVEPGIYAIGNPATDMTPDGSVRASRITEATLYCTGQRSSVALVPNDNPDGSTPAYLKFQCIYFPNDAQ